MTTISVQSKTGIAKQGQKTADQPNFFPDLPPYTDPTTGLLSKLPQRCIPYGQLMRLDRPAGFYAFYFPYVMGVLYAACISPSVPGPSTVLPLIAILLPFNIVQRGAACAWNYNVDQGFDRRVARTRHRPVARGAVSTRATNIFTLLLLLCMYSFFALNLLPASCKPHAIITTVLFFVYALMKRVTFYPQVFLGFPFAWAIFFCVAALGMDPFEGGNARAAPTLALFAANVFWTITYDTIYAHQDIADDERAGVKSMARRFRSSTKAMGAVFSVLQVLSLALCGRCAGFGVLYYLGSVAGVAAGMAWYIYCVDLASPESCGRWFHYQFWIVGAAFTSGLAGEYVLRLVG